jgi:hypothetical protein
VPEADYLIEHVFVTQVITQPIWLKDENALGAYGEREHLRHAERWARRKSELPWCIELGGRG